MATRVYQEDGWLESARKIYEEFEINQSCTISGFVQMEDRVSSKAELVIEELERRYKEDYMYKPRDGRERVKRLRLKDSIGGDASHPIWRFLWKTKEYNPSVSIWRVQ